MREKHSPVFAAFAVFAALSSSLAAQEAAPPEFGEVVRVDVVNVDAYVTGPDGRPVAGLGQDDFEVFEDGKRVEVTNFEAVDRARPAGSTAPAGSPPAPGSAAALSEDGLHLVVYFDNFNLRVGNRARAVRQLREFLTRQLVPGDRVMIVSYDLGLFVRLPFTSDPAALSAALDRLEKLTVQGEEDDRAKRQAFQAMMDIQTVSLNSPVPIPCPLDIVTPAQSYSAAKRQEVQRTLGALTVLVNSLSGVPGRKALLHVSDGISFTPGEELFQFLYEICGGGGAIAGFGSSVGPNSPNQSPNQNGRLQAAADPANTIYDSRVIGPQAYQAASQAAMDAQTYSVAGEVRSLAAHANAHRVTLYTLQASGAEPGTATDASFGPNERLFQIPSIAKVDLMNRQGTLTALASATGGRAILDTADFLPDLSRMRQDFDRYYSLGYTPSHSGDGKEHRIEVRMKRPGLKVRSRQSYRDKPALERTVDRTLAALFYDIQENPLEIAMEVGEPAPDAKGQFLVPVNLRIPLFKLGILNDQGEYRGKLRLFVASRNDKGMTPVRQVEVPLQIPREQVLTAMGKHYVYSLSLQMARGEQLVAVAVRDEMTATTSYLAKSVQVGAASGPGGSSGR